MLPLHQGRKMAASRGIEPRASCLTGRPHHPGRLLAMKLERPVGFEPTFSGWKPDALPLDDERIWCRPEELNLDVLFFRQAP